MNITNVKVNNLPYSYITLYIPVLEHKMHLAHLYEHILVNYIKINYPFDLIVNAKTNKKRINFEIIVVGSLDDEQLIELLHCLNVFRPSEADLHVAESIVEQEYLMVLKNPLTVNVSLTHLLNYINNVLEFSQIIIYSIAEFIDLKTLFKYFNNSQRIQLEFILNNWEIPIIKNYSDLNEISKILTNYEY